MERRHAAHGTWASPITPELAAAGAVRVGGLRLDGEDLYWVEGRPSEQGRNVLVRRHADGRVEDLTPAGLNVRSRVHEYGGGAFTVRGGAVFFVNDADQRLYRQDPGAAPRPLTPEGGGRFADLEVDGGRQRLLCVREEHGGAGEPVNTLVAVPLDGGEPVTLAAGADFYSSPRLDPTGARLAWLTWSHPRMPWQETELWLASLDAEGRPGPAEKVAGGAAESIFQPAWSPDGDLHFVSDRSGWWNLYRAGDPRSLWPIDAELGQAHWVFGLSTYGWVSPRTIACAFQQAGTWRLALLEPAGAGGGFTPRTVDLPLTELGYLQGGPGRALFVGGSPTSPAAIWGVSVAPGSPPTPSRLHQPAAPAVEEAYLSRPQPVAFPTANGATAFGLHYPPHSPDHAGLPDERPPLIVISHGGPTSAATTGLNLAIQFWTSRGFAVLDVNYRGSTGYGRRYREALDGAWGIADVEDCGAGARYLVAHGLADGDRLAIRGGSAGGYTTLAALAFTGVFRAGASYYGVSDLEALARDTHKFECRYLDSLIGPYPKRRDLYLERSPIHHAGRLSCPVIFFQGLEDKVVPPDQAERMVEALRAKGLHVEYVPFSGEQHGFRRAETITRALQSELAFYRRVFALLAD
jgi:dipeptidyl aminopeptidase/acylaminoacyl peptidase